MLRVLNLETGYGKLRVLKGVSLHVSAGEIVTLIGANGAGKSTLLQCVSGVVRPWAGEVFFDGVRTERAATERIVAMGCSLVPEGRHVFGPMTVRENLALGGYIRRGERGREESAAALEEVYELFPVLRQRRDQLAGTLSGGEQQMLAIGRALMARPKLVMMDEPSMGIAPRIVQMIYETLPELKKKGMTLLLVEQNARAALRVADRGYVMETGQIVCEGDAEELLGNHDVQRAYLGKDFRRIDE
jgi:branched-chain amino acid transport system ATP-binding protein